MEGQRSTSKTLWLWFVIVIGISLVSIWLFALNAATLVPESWGVDSGARNNLLQWISSIQLDIISPIVLCLLGVLILTRRPGHVIGRLLVALSLVTGLSALFQEWGVYGYFTRQAEIPGVTVSAWITNWIWVLLFFLLCYEIYRAKSIRFPTSEGIS